MLSLREDFHLAFVFSFETVKAVGNYCGLWQGHRMVQTGTGTINVQEQVQVQGQGQTGDRYW